MQDAGHMDESTNNSMEFAALVSLRISLGILGLARAVLAKVFRGFRRRVCKEFHLHPAQRLP